MNFKYDLNEEQKKVVNAINGPILVLAGAGSGKTHSMTYRTANMIKKGVSPGNILMLTFTNKAANEMKARIGKSVNTDISKMWIGTFHSVALRILSENIKAIGYKPNYIIYDSQDQKRIIKNLITEFDMKEQLDVGVTLNAISNAKMNLVSPEDYISHMKKSKNDFNDFYYLVETIYVAYQEVLENSNAFDFNDLIMKAIKLLQSNKLIRQKYQHKFKYIQVDEFQDTNTSQNIMCNILSKPEENIFAVGDLDQSIYGFRGANIDNIMKFEKFYSDARVLRLERNYRSSNHIVEASNHLIKNNDNRPEKTCWTAEQNGPKIIVSHNPTGEEEAEFVAKTIRKLNYDYSDVAILYRSHYLSSNFEQEFIDKRIPYRIIGSMNFFGRKEIKYFMSILKFAVNEFDNMAIEDLAHLCGNKIGATTVSRLKKHSLETGIKLVDIIPDSQVVKGIGKQRAKELMRFKENYLDRILSISNSDKDLYTKAKGIYDLVSDNIVDSFSENKEDRRENIEELLNIINRYYNKDNTRTLQDFIQYITLISDQDEVDEDEEAVTMMTVHASKGLEFPVIFVVGLEEDVFPHMRAMEENGFEGLEEERRLFYVAITRAENRLFLTHSNTRMFFGNFKQQTQSRFIEELPATHKKEIYNNSYQRNAV